MQSGDGIGKSMSGRGNSKCKDPARGPDAETGKEIEEMARGGRQVM